MFREVQMVRSLPVMVWDVLENKFRSGLVKLNIAAAVTDVSAKLSIRVA